MSQSLVWITGASSGIGQALVQAVPWADTRVIGISRRPPAGAEHLPADLAEPSSWPAIGTQIRSELVGFTGERVVFVHAAGTVQPIGFAGEVDAADYTANVLLNSAAAQVLGHLFLAAVREIDASRHLLMLTSGAARNVHAGWTSYGAGKTAIDQWVRTAGEEQTIRGGVQVLAVAPGTVQTDMQRMLRESSAEQFPQRQRFVDLHEAGGLTAPADVAATIWGLLDRGLDNGSVVDLRDLP